MSWLGLARVRRVAPTPCIGAKPDQVTLDTVRAVIVNRLHVLRHYSRAVIRPVLRQERRSAVNASRPNSRSRQKGRRCSRHTSTAWSTPPRRPESPGADE